MDDTNREEGIVQFFDKIRGFGFCTPAGDDPSDKSKSLFISGYAVKRAGLSSLGKGARIVFRREKSGQGRRDEVQDIELVDKHEDLCRGEVFAHSRDESLRD